MPLAGGLGDPGGVTSAVAVAPERIVWSQVVDTAIVPAAVRAVEADGAAPVVVTDEAVWLLDRERTRVVGELPRLAGVPVVADDGTAPVLVDGRVLEVDVASATIVRRHDAPGLTVPTPLWARSTTAGWAAVDPSGGLVHVGRDGTWWTHPTGGAGVVEVAGTLIASPTTGVEALDPRDGRTRWRADGATHVAGRADRVVVLREPDGALRGVDPTSGRTRWTVDLDRADRVLGLVDEVLVVRVPDDELLRLHAPDTGALVGTLATPVPEGAESAAWTLRAVGDHLAVADRDARTLHVFGVDGRLAWTVDEPALAGLAADGDVLAVTGPRGTRVLDARFGDPYLPTLPRLARAAGAGGVAVGGGRVIVPTGEAWELDTGERVEGTAGALPTWTSAFGIGDGWWLQDGGRTSIRSPAGRTRWRSRGGEALVPLADTPHGLVVAVDDGAIGAVRLLDPRDGTRLGPGVLDAGLASARAVVPGLVVGTWTDRVADRPVTVAIGVSRDGLAERWRSDVVGRVLGDGGDRLVVVGADQAVRIDPADGRLIARLPLPVLPSDAVLLGRTLVLATDERLVGLDLDDPEAAPWEHDLAVRISAPLAASAGRVHVGLEDGRVVTVSADGAVLDDRDLGTVPRGLLAADDLLLVRGDRRLLALGPG